MIKRHTEMDVETRDNMRGGSGSVCITHIMKSDDLTGKCRFMAKISMAPGASIGLHSHDGEEEVYYVLCGTASVEDNGLKTTVRAGDAVLTGGGASHSISNVGDDALEFLATILTY